MIAATGSRLLIGAVAAGILAGLVAPDWAARLKPFADAFVNLLGWLATPLLFCMLASGAAGMQEGRRLGKAGVATLLYFFMMSLLALSLGMLVAWLLEPGLGLGLDPGLAAPALPSAPPVADSPGTHGLLERVLAMPALHLNVLLLLAALPVGLLARAGQGQGMRRAIEGCRMLLMRAVALLLVLSPGAAFCAMAYVVARYGMAVLLPLLAFIVAVNLASILFLILGLGTALRFAGASLPGLLVYLRRELLLVFVTGSSLAGLTPLARKMEALGCSASLTALVLPLSYSLNLAGTYVYLGSGVVFLAQANHVALGWKELLAIAAVVLVTGRTAASVAGSGFAALAATVAVLQIVPVASVGLLLGIDRTMKCRLLTNVIGHGVACIALAAGSGNLDGVRMRRKLGRWRRSGPDSS